MIPAGDAPRLVDALPELAREIEDALSTAGRPELAAQLPELRITVRCACDNEACLSFYTVPRPIVRWFRRGRQIELEGVAGVVILDVVGGEIVYVEVLFRDDVRAGLARAFTPRHAVS